MCQRSFCSQEQWLHKHVKWLHLVLWVITAVRKCGPCMQFIWNSQCRMRLAIAFSLWRVVLLQGSCKYATEFTKLCSCRRLHITTCWLKRMWMEAWMPHSGGSIVGAAQWQTSEWIASWYIKAQKILFLCWTQTEQQGQM